MSRRISEVAARALYRALQEFDDSPRQIWVLENFPLDEIIEFISEKTRRDIESTGASPYIKQAIDEQLEKPVQERDADVFKRMTDAIQTFNDDKAEDDAFKWVVEEATKSFGLG